MVMARMIVISLMVGFVAAGFTWLGWQLVANIWAAIGRAATRRAEESGGAEGEGPSEPPE